MAASLKRPTYVAPNDSVSPKDPLVAALARRTRTVSPEQVTLGSRSVTPVHTTASVPVRTIAPRVTTPPKPKNGPEARKYPRAPLTVRAHLQLTQDPRRSFEATLATSNISIGGLFVESTFFLKMGTQLDVTLELPNHRKVNVRAEVVRVESGKGSSGFALRFTHYLGGSEVILATHFLSPILKDFLAEYAKEHGFKPTADYIDHSIDLLAAWELRRGEMDDGIWMAPKG